MSPNAEKAFKKRVKRDNERRRRTLARQRRKLSHAFRGLSLTLLESRNRPLFPQLRFRVMRRHLGRFPASRHLHIHNRSPRLKARKSAKTTPKSAEIAEIARVDTPKQSQNSQRSHPAYPAISAAPQVRRAPARRYHRLRFPVRSRHRPLRSHRLLSS